MKQLRSGSRGPSLLSPPLIRQQLRLKCHGAAKRCSEKVERARVHLSIFAINPPPNPPFPGEKKGKQSNEASSRECIAPAKQRLFFLIKSCSEAEGKEGKEGKKGGCVRGVGWGRVLGGFSVVSELGHCLLTAVYLTH